MTTPLPSRDSGGAWVPPRAHRRVEIRGGIFRSLPHRGWGMFNDYNWGDLNDPLTSVLEAAKECRRVNGCKGYAGARGRPLGARRAARTRGVVRDGCVVVNRAAAQFQQRTEHPRAGFHFYECRG